MMKNIVFILLLALILSSCYTRRQCMDLCYNSRDTITNIITKDSTVIKDSLIEVQLPPITIRDTIPCNDSSISVTKTISSNFATATLVLKDNKVYFTIADKDTSIFVKVRTLEYYKNYYRELFIKELVANKTEVAPETFATKLGNFVLKWLNIFVYLLICIVLIYMEYKLNLIAKLINIIKTWLHYGK